MKIYQMALFFMFLAGCATTSHQKVTQDNNVKYYYGEINKSSGDGKNSYGKSFSLVKRTIDAGKGIITEIALQPPRDPKKKMKDIHTILTRVGNTNEFTVTDLESTFSGKIIFEGTEEWNWHQWKYDIKLESGRKLGGKGSVSPDGIKTEKIIYRKSGKPFIQLKEELKPITAEEYEQKHKQLTANL